MQIHRTFALQNMLFDFKSPTIDCLNIKRSENFEKYCVQMMQRSFHNEQG